MFTKIDNKREVIIADKKMMLFKPDTLDRERNLSSSSFFSVSIIFQVQFQHSSFKYNFNTHISSTVSTRTFELQFQHTHFRRNFNTHISGAVSTHTFQVQFQLTHFKCSFNTYNFNRHISSTVSTHTFQVQFQRTHFKRKLQLVHFMMRNLKTQY